MRHNVGILRRDTTFPGAIVGMLIGVFLLMLGKYTICLEIGGSADVLSGAFGERTKGGAERGESGSGALKV
jgi:uncharacterized YccA/Bax inhibitor family protein